jgi:hypothetical protein
MKNLLIIPGERLISITLVSVFFIVMTSMSIQGLFLFNHFLNRPQPDLFGHIKVENEIAVGEVFNKVVMGKLAGSRNLAFGVKNMLEENLVELDYNLTSDANKKIEVEILYLDVLKTQINLSMFHKNTESVVIRMRGKLYVDNKPVKTIIVEESADEVSMAALLIDEGGKFNQQNLSTALKKCSNSLITKLLK